MKTIFDPIDWQDIRLVCGEGKLTATDVLASVNIILKQRRERYKSIQQLTNDAVPDVETTN